MDGYRELANAVVIQAVKDWREAAAHPRSQKAKETLAECEAFFRSDWCMLLSNMDGKVILEKLRREKRKNES